MLDKFEFEGKYVHMYGTWDNPLFVAKDACKILGIKNVSQACSTLDDDEVLYVKQMNAKGGRPVLCVTESGLYSLVFQSRKPEAKKFKKHVTSVVLPEIRVS